MEIPMIIEKKKLSELKPAPYNPRQSTAKQEKHLKASLEKFGVVEPIIYNKQTGYIVGGHFRVRELKKLGYKEIECVIVDLNQEDERELNIRLNANTGEWDWDILANEWDAESLEEWGLDLPIEMETHLEAEEDDFEIPDEIKTDIIIGDLFEIGEHRLLCGDSTDSDQVAKLMNGQKADMVFTDPPYGMFLDTDYSKIKGTENSIGFKGNKTGNKYDKIIGDNEDFTPELINTIFASFPKTKEIFIWGADYFVDLLPNYVKDGSWLVWNKRSSEAQQRVIGNCFELCWSLNKHKRFVLDFEWFGFLSKDDPNEARNRQHPSMKPSKLISRMINEFCKDATIIVDIFLGSGTTMLASHQLKRKCYGMELDPKYCQVIIDRMIKLEPTIKIKKNGVELK
jgi:DNA modification methylase